MIILAILSFTALCLGICNVIGQTSIVPDLFNSNVHLQFTRAEQDSILKSRTYLIKNLLPKDPSRKLWCQDSGFHNGNEYKISFKFGKKDTSINFFYFYLVQNDLHTAIRYWPKKNATVILIFTFKEPCEYCVGFDEMRFGEFKEAYTEADYFDFSRREKPKYVWLRIPEISTIQPSVLNDFIEITDNIIEGGNDVYVIKE
jgi:hypothetical protein